MKDFKRPTMLMILDGFGIREESKGNAIKAAKTPALDHIFETYPNTTLKACGRDVGLPDGQMGNSEVGHLNIGAGRIVYQDLSLITKAIEDGDAKELGRIMTEAQKLFDEKVAPACPDELESPVLHS